MMYYFYAPSGQGKSALKTAMLEPFLRNDFRVNMDKKGLLEFLRYSPEERLKMSHNRIDYINQVYGTNFEKPIHVVQSNETIHTKYQGKVIFNYDMPGDKIGLYDDCYETYCPPPCSIIAWDETQKEASGRDSSSMDSRVASLLQLHRKWGLDILCFSQRSTILDLNIRDNCRIIEIESMRHKYDKYGFIISTTWKLKVFYKLKDLERYNATGEKTYKSTEFTYIGNVYEHFDSDEGEEYFVYLAMKRGLNFRVRTIINSVDDYVKQRPYTPPDSYRKTTKAERRRLEEERTKQKEEDKKDVV